MQETQAAPVAEAQNTATEQTQEAPEVVTQEPTAEPAQESPEEAHAKAIKRMERRIDKRTADVYRERAEKEQLAQRIAALEAKLTPDEDAPKPVVDPVALAREIAAAERLDEKCNAIAAKGRKEFPDFADALAELSKELPLFDKRGPTDVMKVVLEADNPPALLHYLGKNPDIASDLADLSPIQLTRRLDRIEREMAVAPKTSAAPKPITPVKAVASESGLSAAKSDEDWARAREAELREKRIRI
jgi:hypothetical protein